MSVERRFANVGHKHTAASIGATGTGSTANFLRGDMTWTNTLLANGATYGAQVPDENSYSAFQVNNASGARRLEMGYIGSTRGAGYGAAPGTTFINSGSTALTISTHDAARIKLDSSQSTWSQDAIQFGTGTASVFGGWHWRFTRSTVAYLALSNDGVKEILLGCDSGDPFLGTFSNHPLALRSNNVVRAYVKNDDQRTIEAVGRMRSNGSGGSSPGMWLYTGSGSSIGFVGANTDTATSEVGLYTSGYGWVAEATNGGSFRVNSDALLSNGLYSRTDTSKYLLANNGSYTYGSHVLSGSAGGYTGLILSVGDVPTFMANASVRAGVYLQSPGRWAWYDDNSCFRIFRTLELNNAATFGAAGALVGYVEVSINGTSRKIPYYS